MKPEFHDLWYTSVDGLKLYARDYQNSDAKLTVLCMPGLTRNSADFEHVCVYLAPEYRVVAAEQRGRGQSEYDPNPDNYHPVTYAADMFRLIETAELDNVVLLGTSLGGLMAMAMNAARPGAFKGFILNDIGPEVDEAGLERIKGYVGKTGPVATWEEAAAQARELNQAAFPDYGQTQWNQMARRMFHEDVDGVPVLSYDPAIARPIDADDSSAVPPDLWAALQLLDGTPTLLIRGELSDILAEETFDRMGKVLPGATSVVVPRVGHAPMLDEPVAREAITQFLSELT